MYKRQIYFAVAVYGAAYSPAIAADAVRSTQRAWLALLITFCAVGTFAMLEGRSIDHVSSALLPSLTGLACTLGVARTALALMLGSAWWSERSGRHRTILLVDGDASPFTPMDGLVIDAVRHGLRADVHDPDVLERLGALAGRADRLVVSCPQDRRAAWAAALRLRASSSGEGKAVETVLMSMGLRGLWAAPRGGRGSGWRNFRAPPVPACLE